MKTYMIICIGVLIVTVFLAVYVATTYNVWYGGMAIGAGIASCGVIKGLNDNL